MFPISPDSFQCGILALYLARRRQAGGSPRPPRKSPILRLAAWLWNKLRRHKDAGTTAAPSQIPVVAPHAAARLKLLPQPVPTPDTRTRLRNYQPPRLNDSNKAV